MKLNKKGFTLVELLAVIVVLALLMVVAGSSIGSALKNSKISATKTEAQKLLKSLFEEKYALASIGGITAAAEGSGDDGADFIYKYTFKTTGEISSFCLKHKDGIYVTGSVDSVGKITIADPKEVNPRENSICDGDSTKTTLNDCETAKKNWLIACP